MKKIIINQKLYEPQNIKNLKKIIKNPDLFIEILIQTEKEIKEKLYV